MMKMLTSISNKKNAVRLALAALALSLLSASPALSGARPQATITVVNNSQREIRHLYLSPVDSDNWGPDQLNQAVIAPGGSFSFSATCQQSQVKVVAEDKDGCFLYKTVDCSGNSSWTITNDDTPNCGG